MNEEYLTTSEVALIYRTSPGTVRYWRCIGYGPKGVKVGRRVLYPQGELRRWDEQVRRAEDEPTSPALTPGRRRRSRNGRDVR